MRKLLVVTFLIIAIFSQAALVNALEPDTGEALKFTKPPTIDGTISPEEWGEPTKKDVQHGSPANAIARNPEQGIKFDLWLRYDDNNVYIALQTPDENLINTNSGHDMWNGDAIQLEVDPLGNWQSQGKSDYYYLSDNAREIAYSYSSKEHKSQAWCYTIGGEPEGEFAVANRDGLTTYEISIPWSFFDVEAPAAGSDIGFTVALLTCRDYSYDGWLEYGSGCLLEKSEEDSSGNNKIVLSESEFTPADTYPTFEPTPEPTPEPTDDGEEEDKSSPLVTIGIIAALVVVAIIVVIIIRSKKKQSN